MGKVIIMFGTMRCGSTLFMRLMRKCVDHKGRQVVFTGEHFMLHEVHTLYKKIIVRNNNTYAMNQDQMKRVINAVSDSIRGLCGAKQEDTWGFKELHSGRDRVRFKNYLMDLISIFPDVIFIFVKRDPSDSAKSIIRDKWYAYGNTHMQVVKHIERKQANYAEAELAYPDRSYTITYEGIQDFIIFSRTMKAMGLGIPKEAYNSVIDTKLR